MLRINKNFILKTVCAVLILHLFTGCNNKNEIYAEIPPPELAKEIYAFEPSEIISNATENENLTDKDTFMPESAERITSEPATTEPPEIPAPAEDLTVTENGTEILVMEPVTEPPEIKPVVITSKIYQNNLADYNAQGTDKIAGDYYLLPSYWIQSDDKRIIDLAGFITDGIAAEYDKAKAIYNWVANNIWQDLDYKNGDGEIMARRMEENPVDALNTLNTKVGMCVHYAKLTVAISRAAGIPAKIMRLEDGHEFCEIYAGGKWIIMDPYFDSNNQYENGKYGPANRCGSRFFDMTVQDIWERRAWYFQEYLDFAYYVETNYFYGDKKLESVVIPDGFYSIGDIAFYGCENLTSVWIPDSVTLIGEKVFDGCPENLIIYGGAGSYAEKYAGENNIKFEVRT